MSIAEKEKIMDEEDAPTRYIGDVIFDHLMSIPNFRTTARELVISDWRNGTSNFRLYAEPMIPEHLTCGQSTYVDLRFSYLENRVMEGMDPVHDPWLWAYKNLTGACLDPDTVRKALNDLEGSK